MHVLRDQAAVSQLEDPQLRRLVERRIGALLEDYADYELSDLALFVVLEPGDPLQPLSQHLGFHVLENRFDGARFGQPGFSPSWDLMEDHGHCYELVFITGQDGFGVDLFVPKRPEVAPELLAMCQVYAVPALEQSS